MKEAGPMKCVILIAIGLVVNVLLSARIGGGSSGSLFAADCNRNGIDDATDISAGTSTDSDSNGIPDECQPQTDCNANTVADFCDVAAGTSDDCDSNGVPDECQFDGVFTILSADFEAVMPASFTSSEP